MSHPNNLFSFATSELSQDAFLCWLAALANDDDADLRRLGKSFIAWLWRRSTGTTVDAVEVQLVQRPKPQWMKIDVTLDVVIAGTRARIIIEDKTETSQHGGQLERYLEVARKDGVPTAAIYLKTGYHFGSDDAAVNAGYTVVGLREWVEFLSAQTVRNDILADYGACMSELLRQREEALVKLATAAGFKQFKEGFVQYEFLGDLGSSCPETIGGGKLNRGTNMGGSPWTHHRFVCLPGALPGGVDEVLFHRIDNRQNNEGKPGYYLSTRQYATVKRKPEAAAAKLARLKNYRIAFSAAVAEAGKDLSFSTPANDFRGANESEIGILFFDDKRNTTAKVLELFPAVHRAFVAGVAQRVSL